MQFRVCKGNFFFNKSLAGWDGKIPNYHQTTKMTSQLKIWTIVSFSCFVY